MSSIDKSLPTAESLGLTKPHQAHEKKRLGQEDFMKLMTAQLNHQDPMKPMENGDFLTQMAQFSTVSGMKEIKQSFASLANSLQSNQALQASSMVGRYVLIPGKQIELTENESIRAAVVVPTSATDLRVNIMNSSGELVHSMSMGQQQAGTVNIEWDGMIKTQQVGKPGELEPTSTKAAAGLYTIQAGILVDGKSQAVQTLVADSVESVSMGKPGEPIILNLKQSGQINLPDVKQIL